MQVCCELCLLPGCPDAVCGQLDALHEEAGSILEDLRSVMPERNLGVPNAGFGRPHPTSAAGKQAQEEEHSSDEEEGESSMDDTPDSSLDKHGLASRADEDTGKAWTFPKAHAMYHATTTVRLYGPLEWSSAETVERRHVEIKEAFTRTNNRKECEVQVLRGEMRIDDSTGGRTRPRDDADGCQTGAGTSEPARVNASFSDTLHRSARRYPGWHAAEHWRHCLRVLKFEALMTHVVTAQGWQSQARVTIPLPALYDAGSEWRKNCPDTRYLPAELARYIRDEFSAHWGEGQFPRADEDTLTWPQIVELCGMVQTCSSRPTQGAAQRYGPSETHLAVFNALEIVCPDVPGEVSAVHESHLCHL